MRYAAAGAAAPAAFLLLLAAGVPAPWISALAFCGLLALPLPDLRSCAGFAAAALVSALVALPLGGCAAALALAAALAFAGRRSQAAERQPPSWDAALAAAAAVGFARCGAFLLGHSLYAFCAVVCGWAAGVAAGRTARAAAGELGARFAGARAALAGLAGAATLQLLRVMAVNANEAWRVERPVGGLGDGIWIAGHAAAGAFALSAALTAFAPAEETPAPRWAALAPLAGAALLSYAGPPGAVALVCAALGALGALRALRSASCGPVARAIACGAAAAAFALGALGRSALADAEEARLISVYAVGKTAARVESRGRELAVHRFDPGPSALLSDGVADFESGDPAAALGAAPFFAHPAVRALFVGVLHPEAYGRAKALGAQVELLEPHAACARVLLELAQPDPAPAQPCGARLPKGPFEVVVVDVPPPHYAPESALMLTRDAARAWKRRMTAKSLLAWRVPARPEQDAAKRAAAALRAEFGTVVQAGIGRGTVLLAGDVDLQALAIAGASDFKPVAADAAAPDRLWRPLTAFPARLGR